jgi:superoxide dismutase, Fe-Mn family
MAREAKNYDHLIGKVQGLSEAQLKNHFTLYGGYVKKLNEIDTKLAAADRSAPNYSYNEYSELKRREPVAYNGTFLHELYFDNLTAPGTQPSEGVKKGLTDSFGSYDAWVADARAALASAHGWLLTCWSYNDMKIRNVLVQSEHHVGLQVDTQVLIAIDAWEHAYFMDYGTKKPDYVSAMIQAIDWTVVDGRAKNSPLLHPSAPK